MQDKAFAAIGKIALKEMGNKEPYQFFIQNMFPEKTNYKMIVISFTIETIGNKLHCSFKNIDSENVNKANYVKYAYRKGASRGGDITFTTKFGDVEKKLNTLVENQFKTLISKHKNSGEISIFSSIYEFLCDRKNYETIKNQLLSIQSQLSKEDKLGSGLSIRIFKDGKENYLADFIIIQETLKASGTENKSEKYGITSKGTNAVCSICLKNQPLIHGFGSPFKFATVDKPGMVSGFFNQANNWKNYPICSQCSMEFELGRNYVVNNFSGYFFGKSYYMVPKTILSRDSNALERAIKRLKTLKQNYADLSKENSLQMVQSYEDSIERMIAKEEKEDLFSLDLLFYEENPTTKAIKIKLMLEEILPSRFRKLFLEAPDRVNMHPLYRDALTSKKQSRDLRFSFGILKTFFENEFYSLIQTVYMLQRFSPEYLYASFMDVIRTNYNKMKTADKGYVEHTYLSILKAHLTLSYFQELNLIDYHPNFTLVDINEKTEKKGSFDMEKLKQFLKENKGFIDTDYKAGLFSVGILVRLLLNIQQVNLGNTPFEKKLKGYNLNAELLRTVYMEALNKISQYQGFYAYSNLREFIDEYFILNTDKINKLSNNELSFYFVAGLEFGNKFKNRDLKEETQLSEN